MHGGRIGKMVVMTNLDDSKNNEVISLNDFRELINKINEVVLKIIDNCKSNPMNERMFEPGNFDRYVNESISFLNILVSNIFVFYEEKPERLIVELRDKTFYQFLIDFFNKIDFILKKDSEERKVGLVELYKEVMQIQNVFYMFESSIRQKENIARSVQELNSKVLEVDDRLKDLDVARMAVLGQKTEEIYSAASTNYLDAARNYEVIFYLLLLGSFLFTIISLSVNPYTDLNKINFILTKVITITLVITLGTLFLRKAAHLRKLHEQANQTSLELQALPLYLRNISTEHHSEIYKELATKYFGKELDQTQNDKVGDLMKDQLAAGTELIKASAELVKAKNGSSSS